MQQTENSARELPRVSSLDETSPEPQKAPVWHNNPHALPRNKKYTEQDRLHPLTQSNSVLHTFTPGVCGANATTTPHISKAAAIPVPQINRVNNSTLRARGLGPGASTLAPRPRPRRERLSLPSRRDTLPAAEVPFLELSSSSSSAEETSAKSPASWPPGSIMYSPAPPPAPPVDAARADGRRRPTERATASPTRVAADSFAYSRAMEMAAIPHTKAVLPTSNTPKRTAMDGAA